MGGCILLQQTIQIYFNIQQLNAQLQGILFIYFISLMVDNFYKHSLQRTKNKYNTDATYNNSDEIEILKANGKSKIGGSKQNPDSLFIIIILGLCFFICLALFLALNIYPNLQFERKKQQITIVCLTVGEFDLSMKSIQSLLSLNKQSRYKYIFGTTRKTQKIKQWIQAKNLPEIEVFHTQSSFYKLLFLDQLIKKVDTELFLLTTTQWTLENSKFINESIVIMEQFPAIGQLFYSAKEITERNMEVNRVGFSFSPGLHRQSDIKKMRNFTSFGSSFSRVTNEIQRKVSLSYYEKGIKAILLESLDIKRIQLNAAFFADNELPYQIKPLSKIQDYVQSIQYTQVMPQKIQDAEKLTIKQLPFCLIVIKNTQYSLSRILKSIKRIKYGNFKIVVPPEINRKWSYYDYQYLIKGMCPPKSIIMFVNNLLNPNSLQQLNKIHQQNWVWVTYAETHLTFEIVSVLFRVYQMLALNDFDKTNKLFLQEENLQIQAIGLLQLSCLSNMVVDKKKIVEERVDNLYLSVHKSGKDQYKRTPYQKILSLSQDMPIEFNYFYSAKRNMKNLQSKAKQQLSSKKIIRAAERQQIPYLPENHTINYIQFLQFQKTFNITRYNTLYYQTKFCVTILSHNNIQNSRYKKVIDTIVQQKYENYHIVFIDDKSDDENLNKTIEYFNYLKFPKDRIKFIKNLKRNYATYNIINSAFNFCQDDEIQLLVDGDDELIGRYAFQVINTAYQNNPELWVVYSNYKSNSYQFGLSYGLTRDQQHTKFRRRTQISAIGPIRTWRVKLIRSIQAKYHKQKNGNWLDTLYDDALQHPLFELSLVKRVKYINQILYEYNNNYGDNDGSTPQKLKHRLDVYKQVIKEPPLAPLRSLDEAIEQKSIRNELTSDEGVKFKVVEQKE